MSILTMTLSEIKTAVCEAFQIEESDFVLYTWERTHCYARYAYFVLCTKYTNEIQKRIADSVLMCHKSVYTGLKRHGELIETKRDYAFSFREANNKVKQLKDSK